MTEPTGARAGALDGLVVLDLSVALAGPLMTLHLASMGATVIKIESPSGSDIARANPPYLGSRGLHNHAMEGDDISVSMMDRARGKQSLTLDLKSERGHETFLRLAEKADVVVENMSSGTAHRLGVDYDAVRTLNPGLVYCSISAFGRSPSYQKVKGMDILIQAASGLMAATGFADSPPLRSGIPIGDIVGSLYAGIGILAAIRDRDRTGLGQLVEISLLDGLVTLIAEEHFDADLRPADLPPRTGNTHERLTPFGAYPTADGFVALAAPNDAMSHQLFVAIGRPELAADARFSTRGPRSGNADALNRILTEWFCARTTREVLDQLVGVHGVPVVEVLDPRDSVKQPEHLLSGAVSRLAHPTLGTDYGEPVLGTGLPIRFSASAVDLTRPAPLLGADSAAVLKTLLGASDADIDELRRDGVI